MGQLPAISQPKTHGLTQETLEKTLIDFCARCLDLVRERGLVVECLEPMSDEELVDRALQTPTRSIADVLVSIIPVDHPARAIAN